MVDNPGDNLLCEFPAVTSAVACALEIQRALGELNAPLPSERRLVFRIGVHLGEVLAQGPRIYGDGVNIAARLEGLAELVAVAAAALVLLIGVGWWLAGRAHARGEPERRAVRRRPRLRRPPRHRGAALRQPLARPRAGLLRRRPRRGPDHARASGQRVRLPELLELRAELARQRGAAPERAQALREALGLYQEMGAAGHAERIERTLFVGGS